MNVESIMPVSPIDRMSSLAEFSIDRPAAKPSAAEVAKAARQFEAIMVRQLLAPAIEPMMNGGSLGGEKSDSGGGGGVYGYMLTDVLANAVTQGGGLGLSKVIASQLSTPDSGASKK